MDSNAAKVDRLAPWEERQQAVYRVIPVVALGVSTLLAAFVGSPGAASLTGTVVISVEAAIWLGGFLAMHRRLAHRRILMAAYYVGLLVFAAVLVLRSPWYGFFAWTGFVHAFLALPGRWWWAGIAGSGLIIAMAQNGGLPRLPGQWLPFLLIVLFNIGVGGLISWFGRVGEEQNTNRKQLVTELAEANQRLAETMRENEGLHAQLITQAREAGVLDERQRMAREIHDTLAQGLIGIITQLAAAEQARERRAEWQRHVDHAADLARDSLTEARRAVRALRPEPLETAQLPEAFTELTRRWAAINDVTAEATTTGTPVPLHPEIEVTLLRAGQEALANIAKHAHASRVGLTLSYMDDLVTLDVCDDGVGFAPDQGSHQGSGQASGGHDGGFGLTAMRQRISAVGGELVVESEPGAGTAISASVPFAAQARVA